MAKNTKNTKTSKTNTSKKSEKNKKETKPEKKVSYETRITDLFESAKSEIVCDSDDFETLQSNVLEIIKEMEEKMEKIEKEMEKLEKDLKKAKKTKKAPKDKNAPKKNVSTWVHFCNEHRAEVKAENPELQPKEIMSVLSKMWKEINEEDKKEYEEKAKEDKERYLKEKETYVPVEGSLEAEKEKKIKKKKVPGQPKNSKSAWLFFCEAERKKLDKEKVKRNGKEKMDELSERWSKIKGTKKAKKYEELAKEDKVRFKDEMDEWVPPPKEEDMATSESEGEEEEKKTEPEVVEDSDDEDDVKSKASSKKKEDSDSEDEVEVEEAPPAKVDSDSDEEDVPLVVKIKAKKGGKKVKKGGK